MPLPLEVIDQDAKARVSSLRQLRGKDDVVLVHEIFSSLQGEGTRTGRPCVFIRLTGCHLRCVYCDTEYAFFEGDQQSIDDVIEDVRARNIPFVLLTGGEPLLQPASIELLQRLCDEGFDVALETSGAVNTEKVPAEVSVILDVKTPESGENERMVWENLNRLRPHDEVKFVLSSEKDYRYAADLVNKKKLAGKCEVLFSPETSSLTPTTLANWLVRDALPVRFQIQLHRLLWGDVSGV
ncbi:MAG: radical SAM protein [Deltaproteobacteria bacterium]|nr:radical SAM protein [Deltaproteobacteria bacterium]